MRLYELLTKKKDDLLLYEEGVLSTDGRLSDEGRRLVVDLMFQGHKIDEVRSLMLEEIKKYKKENK